MMAYFARRIVGGVFTIFVLMLVIFTVITYTPGGPMDMVYSVHTLQPDPTYFERLRAFYHADKPWPVSYLTWLFDPNGLKHVPLSQEATVVEGVQTATNPQGQWLSEFVFILTFILLLFMVVIAAQRRRRPLAVGPPDYPKGRSLLYEYAHPMRVPGL
jgi:ABC-type dipeptide/oligopeptide/nickel transport system permease component